MARPPTVCLNPRRNLAAKEVTDKKAMRQPAFTIMSLQLFARGWPSVLRLMMVLAIMPAFAVGQSAPGDADAIVSTTPMILEAEEAGAHGHLVVTPEIISPDTRTNLIYTITVDPQNGRVGLAGGDGADFFATKTSRLGYFAYRAQDDFAGEDSFTYTVRNETTGLLFQNTVVITVRPPPPVLLHEFEVSATREHFLQVRDISLTTRPNVPVAHQVPSHEDFMTPEERNDIDDAKIAYILDDQAGPQHGTARLDRSTGRLTYAPNPGFIGEDRFTYYTVDENNPHLGAESIVNVLVEPIRNLRQMTVDRSRHREVDLVFVINNSPSMAAHQSRIAENLSRFRELFHARDLDYRIGVLTTDFVNTSSRFRSGAQGFFKQVRSVQLDKAGNPELDRSGRPRQVTKRVASNGNLVTLPVMDQPWVTPRTPDPIFAELVKVGTNGDNNRTAFTSVYNFVAGYYNDQHAFLRPDATTIVVFFMDEEETRMAVWREQRDGSREADWIQNGKLPDLLSQYNVRNPDDRQTLDGYINYWVRRPFIIVKGNRQGNLQIHAVVSPDNISHRRAAELSGGAVLNIEEDFSAPLAALGDRIAETVAVALDPIQGNATLYQPSLRVRVDGVEVAADPENGYIYDELTHSIRFQGDARQKAFAALIDITYEEHM